MEFVLHKGTLIIALEDAIMSHKEHDAEGYAWIIASMEEQLAALKKATDLPLILETEG